MPNSWCIFIRDTHTTRYRHLDAHRHNVWQVHRFLGRLFCGSFNKIIANGRRKTESQKLQCIVGKKKRRVVKKNAVSPPHTFTHARNFDRYTRHPHSAMFLLLLQADFVLIRYFIYVYIIFRSSAFPRYLLAILHFIETHTKRREKKNRRRQTHLEHTTPTNHTQRRARKFNTTVCVVA